MPIWTIPTTLATPIQGSFGKLTLAAGGSYSYTRDAGTAGGADDVFTYTVKDGDGDLSHTTLTISIGNPTPTITNLTPAVDGGDVTVNENDLLASRGNGELPGSDTSQESLTQPGTFTISSPDGIKSLTIDGHTVISNGVFTATSFTTSTLGNTLSVTGYDAATGVVKDSYTLLDNKTHATGAGTNEHVREPCGGSDRPGRPDGERHAGGKHRRRRPFEHQSSRGQLAERLRDRNLHHWIASIPIPTTTTGPMAAQ